MVLLIVDIPANIPPQTYRSELLKLQGSILLDTSNSTENSNNATSNSNQVDVRKLKRRMELYLAHIGTEVLIPQDPDEQGVICFQRIEMLTQFLNIRTSWQDH